MQDDKKHLERLINEYLQGTTTPEEKKHLERWMEHLDVSDGQPAASEFRKMVMKKQIDLRTGALENTKSLHRRKMWWSTAASVLLALAIGAYLWQSNQTEAEDRHTVAAKPFPTIQQVTNNGSQDTLISLSDGSEVLLSSGSALIWPTEFAPDARELRLDGKAFFRVAKDPKRPLSVYSGDIITTALGTSFWIEKMEGKRSPRVKLVTGKVSITQQLDYGQDTLLATLTPGQEWNTTALEESTIVQEKNKSMPARTPQPDTTTALDFHHVPLSEVFPRLAAYYHVTIKFNSDDLKGMSFYGTYDKGNQIQEIIQTIALANDLTVRYDEKEVAYTIKK
ncbi:DUF4974 domain-containing protein [Sphingobacterium phlebotomi]|uniref:DUF4974 domain-containing protein n=1 Tax=Sphingobacterium phlebotomi TaxID=2605433 RepID=A0A5D4H8S3_9SPHI|nr:FecR domain-containing protein [Sphingobacterium phlebotomi]TYR36662.1 DUF4974 domain-containing protein [Sphingobacterium phlebotomi]